MTANKVSVMLTRAHMRPRTLLATLAMGAIALSGCGSGQTKTVSVSSAPVVPAGAGTSSTATTTTGTTSTPATTGTNTTGEANGQSTRTATAPAFTKETASSEGLDGALAVIKAHGYTAQNTSDYHPDQTLRVLVGTRTGSSDGYDQQAFFFVDGSYLGTDTSEPSAAVKVVSQGDTEVTLAYTLYKPRDPLCCATGGQKTIRFQLNNGRLVALDQIPPANSQTGSSRN